MRYFLANGFRPSAHPPNGDRHRGFTNTYFGGTKDESRQERAKRYQEARIEVPKLGEKVFLRLRRIGRISVFVHGAYEAFIMIVASSQRKAYLLGNSLRAALTNFYGHPPVEQVSGFLLELTKRPSYDMDRRDLADLINHPEFPQF